MAIINKTALPDIYGDEANEFIRLLYLGSNRTSGSDVVFDSTTSETTYSTLTSYGGVYSGTGENGLLNMLKVEVLDDYLLTTNWVDSIESTVNSIESRVDSIESTVDSIESSVDSIESTVDSIESSAVEVGNSPPASPNANKLWVDTSV